MRGIVGFYSADAFPGFDYQWEILPASAGAIKSGQGKNAIEVFWQTPGTHTLRVTTCGNTSNFTVTVGQIPNRLLAPRSACAPGIQTLILTTTPFANYTWQTADGNILGGNATANLPAGAYAVTVTDIHGCKGSNDFNIQLYPDPNVSLTTTDPTGFCNNSAYVSMTALVPDDGAFTFEWQRDAISLGATGVVHVTNQYGLYTVVGTNEYGCTATAPPILLFNYCLGGGGGYCPNPPGPGAPPCIPGSIQAVPDPTPRCDSIRLVLNDYTGQYVPGTAQWWTGISGGIGIATASGDNASFIYPNAGKYIVLLAVLLQNGTYCEVIDSIDIEAVAAIFQDLACPGDSTHFTDESTRLPESDITGWQWDFGNGASSSLASPGEPYANAGNYTATLTITTASGCTSTYSENVFVPDVPTPAFTPPLANCAGNASAFTLTNAADIIESSWDFGHPVSGALNQSDGNPAYHNYTPAGNYSVTINATNTYGCKGSSTQTVNIVANPFSGNITPLSSTICEGKTATLIAPSGPSQLCLDQWLQFTNFDCWR